MSADSYDAWKLRADLDEYPPSPLRAPPSECPQWFRAYVAALLAARGWTAKAVEAETLRRWRARR